MSILRIQIALALLAAAILFSAETKIALAKDILVRWQDTVVLEHEDRKRRLLEMSRDIRGEKLLFSEAIIAKSELPASFGTSIPVLRVVFPQKVFFDTDRDAIRPEAEGVIDLVAAVLRREAADTAVFIAGHTDSRATDAYNYDLSVRRAESVARALDRRGVRQAHIWRVGFGEAVPLAPNTTEEGMARNRRVEFLFGRKPEAVGAVLAKQEALICPQASPAQRSDCLRALAVLPRVEAIPVITGREVRRLVTAPARDPATDLPRFDSKTMVPVAPAPSPVVVPQPSLTPKIVPLPEASRKVVTITRDEPIVIDMVEKRVFVERIEK